MINKLPSVMASPSFAFVAAAEAVAASRMNVFAPVSCWKPHKKKRLVHEICSQYAGCEHGCIPIVQCTQKDWDDFYAQLLIEPPWLHADNTRDLAAKMIALANQPQKLYNLQRENQRWWQSIQSVIRNKIWFA